MSAYRSDPIAYWRKTKVWRKRRRLEQAGRRCYYPRIINLNLNQKKCKK